MDGRGRVVVNSLHKQLANRILLHIRVSGSQQGEHVTESSLQNLLGTSRAPIRAALAQLAEEGFLQRVPNRGYFIGRLPDQADQLASAPAEDERIYLSIAEDRLNGRLADTISENEVMRQYGIPRTRLRRILNRIAQEGWIERRDGRGWAFASLIDSVEAYRESYEVRKILEPSGLLCEGFRFDSSFALRLREQQEFVLGGAWRTLSQFELFETNSRFHEGLASMSGNRFLWDAIARQNHLRRLVEYRQVLKRDQVRGQCEEHLKILALLEVGDQEQAAMQLRFHLDAAKIRKANSSMFSCT
ncbi:MAG: hypothetical protein K0S56_2212 [Microvirga sp.]|jgi:DNA-binding GntR family transcriptional regulator|nr:hypothetical protein [Microvirga sp.]